MSIEVTSNAQISYKFNIYNHNKTEKAENVSIFLGEIPGNIEVAIKVYSRRQIDPKNYESEVNILKKYSGKEGLFLKYYGSFQEKKSFYIVMEYLPWTLEAWIEYLKSNNSKLPRDEIEVFMKTLIKGFYLLREGNICHNNISPRNILVDQSFNPKIIDFSNAIILERDSDINYNTVLNKKYIAPELMGVSETSKKSLEKSDVFSLGLVFLETITLADINDLNNTQNISQIYSLIETLPRFIKIVLKNMLDSNPHDRATFMTLMEFFYGKKLTYPIGSITSGDFIDDIKLIKEHDSLTKECSGQINETSVSIKIFSKESEENRKKCDYFVTSMQCLSGKMNCFCEFYGAFEKGNEIWVVFEYCAISFDQIIEAGSYKKLSNEHLVLYYRSLLEGFSYCFRQKIYHNNIKPSSIRLDKNGFIKISDFSLQFLDRDQELQPVLDALKSEAISEELNYVAPEILKSLNSILESKNAIISYSKELADIYSIGLVLYEITTLQKARNFNLKRNSTSLNSMLNLIEIPWGMKILDGMLKYNPNERLSMQELTSLIPDSFN